MGSWNKTCGLSNLHIRSGEKAYVFVLEPNKDNSHCYSTHLYSPLLLPFETTYNDYGGGEDSTGPGFPIIISAIKEHLHEIELGDNKYHDIAVKKDNFDESLFFEAVHEGRLFREGRYSDPVKLEYVMFRKDVVDHILENRVIEQYVGDNKGTIAKWGDSKDYIQYKFADIVADILPLIHEMCDKFNNKDDTFGFRFGGGIEYMFGYDHPNKAAKWLRGDGYRYSRIVDMKSAISDIFENGEPTLDQVLALEALLTEYLKGVFIDSFMEVTRKSWIPGGHEGSQSQELDEYRLLIGAMNKVIDAEQAEYDYENGVDEEETNEE